MAAPTAGVRRDGRAGRILAAELVPGDVLLLGEGDAVTARRPARRGRVARGTGESEPVLKATAPVAGRAALGDRTNMVPDVLLARCPGERVAGAMVELTSRRRAEILAGVDRLADRALRTLAVAYRLPDTVPVADESVEQELIYLGLVGIIDPPRPEAAGAVAEASGAGVRVLMITGDHPRTTARIARDLRWRLSASSASSTLRADGAIVACPATASTTRLR
jgi:magnesium-transporting ATPase (P-type)